tara:strand:+ start:399 stop:608 length:210 start_codon:yes stop_codon:yes gene_type:complete
MALSKQVEDSMKEAERNIREALAFAARTERPYICRELGGMLSHIETLMTTDGLFDKLDKVIKETKDDNK